MPLTLATLVDSVHFFNTTLWQQYRSAKKIEILTLTKIDFSKEKCHEKRLKEQFWTSKFQNLLGGGKPPDPPLVARAFGARDLPRLVLKPGYGPDLNMMVQGLSCT